MHTRSMPSRWSGFAAPAILLLALASPAACSRSDDPPRRPLAAFETAGTATDARSAAPSRSEDAATPLQPLPPDAQAALDEGNGAFRAHDYEGALRAYRRAAAAAPDAAPPWFGVYLVAQQLNQPALADSALRAVRALSGDKLAGSDVRKLHGGASTSVQRPR